MSALLEIITNIEDTQAAIRRLEETVADNPDVPSAVAMLRSLQQRHEDLAAQFSRMTNERFTDVCSYAIFSQLEDEPITLPSLTSTLGDFQNLFTVVYDALRNGPRQRARTNPELTAATAFGFGYAFVGSVGFVLTLPNDRLLVGETDLDRAMRTIFEMAKAEDPEDILSFANELGVAPIRQMYRWVTDHVQSGIGADINWRRQEEVRSSLLVQLPELENLQRAISQTSEEREESLTVFGQLVMADVQNHRFRLVLEEGDIRGSMADAIGVDDTIQLPRRYKAHLRKVTTVSYSTEEERIAYFLLALED